MDDEFDRAEELADQFEFQTLVSVASKGTKSLPRDDKLMKASLIETEVALVI